MIYAIANLLMERYCLDTCLQAPMVEYKLNMYEYTRIYTNTNYIYINCIENIMVFVTSLHFKVKVVLRTYIHAC